RPGEDGRATLHRRGEGRKPTGPARIGDPIGKDHWGAVAGAGSGDRGATECAAPPGMRIGPGAAVFPDHRCRESAGDGDGAPARVTAERLTRWVTRLLRCRMSA